jgi:hypothetical protein
LTRKEHFIKHCIVFYSRNLSNCPFARLSFMINDVSACDERVLSLHSNHAAPSWDGDVDHVFSQSQVKGRASLLLSQLNSSCKLYSNHATTPSLPPQEDITIKKLYCTLLHTIYHSNNMSIKLLFIHFTLHVPKMNKKGIVVGMSYEKDV